MKKETVKIRKPGNLLVDIFHYLTLFVIGATIVWSAVFDCIKIIDQGCVVLKDILLPCISAVIVMLSAPCTFCRLPKKIRTPRVQCLHC